MPLIQPSPQPIENPSRSLRACMRACMLAIESCSRHFASQNSLCSLEIKDFIINICYLRISTHFLFVLYLLVLLSLLLPPCDIYLVFILFCFRFAQQLAQPGDKRRRVQPPPAPVSPIITVCNGYAPSLTHHVTTCP